MGRRRSWILAAQTLMAVTLGAMLLIPDITTSLGALALMVLIHNLCSSVLRCKMFP